jgi:hypothetical protein
MPIEIELPWPASELGANARIHEAKRHRFRRAAKDTAFFLARAALGRKPVGEVAALVYTCHPPRKGRHDDDNMAFRLKASTDGIALALRQDDSTFRIRAEIAAASPPTGRVVARVYLKGETLP